MFTLKYHELSEKTPDHKSQISFYVLNGDFNLYESLEVQFGKVTYGWCSDGGESHYYYNPETESHYAVGSTKSVGHLCYNVKLRLEINGQPVFQNNDEDDLNIAWNYTHEIEREISKYKGKDYFPCFDINNLLREGIVTPLKFDKIEVGDAGQKHFQIYGIFTYYGNVYYLRMSQDNKWSSDDWVKEGCFGEVSVFGWCKFESYDSLREDRNHD